jgi:hypothetical protein
VVGGPITAWIVTRTGTNPDGSVQPSILQQRQLNAIDSALTGWTAGTPVPAAVVTSAADLKAAGIGLSSFPRSYQAIALGPQWLASGRPFVNIGQIVVPDDVSFPAAQLTWFEVLIAANSDDPDQWADAQAAAGQLESLGVALPPQYTAWVQSLPAAANAGGGDGGGDEGGPDDEPPAGDELPIGGNRFAAPGGGDDPGPGYQGGPINPDPNGNPVANGGGGNGVAPANPPADDEGGDGGDGDGGGDGEPVIDDAALVGSAHGFGGF